MDEAAKAQVGTEASDGRQEEAGQAVEARKSGKLLGVHLIVRDEAERLPVCLESVRGLAAEIVAVDTGSADRTVELLQTYGARVLEKAWTDDFAAARNAGLQAADTQWVLVLDADECVEAGADVLLQQLTSASEAVSAMTVGIRNLTDEQSGQHVACRAVRLFRTGRGLHYRGKVHEQLADSRGRTLDDGQIAASALQLRHDGYLPEVLRKRGKPERNRRILEQLLRDAPGHPFHTYNLAVAYCQLGRTEEAADQFVSALAMTPEPEPYRPALCRDAALTLLALGRTGEAAGLLARETERYDDYADLHELYGRSLEAEGLAAEAEAAYGRAIACAEPVHSGGLSEYVTEGAVCALRSLQALAALRLRHGDLAGAESAWRTVLAERPLEPAALRGLVEVWSGDGWHEERIAAALQTLGGLQPGGSDGGDARVHVRVRLAEALAGGGAYAAACTLLEPAPLDRAGRLLRWRCLVQAGRRGEAAAELRRAVEAAVAGLKGEGAPARRLTADEAELHGPIEPAELAKPSGPGGQTGERLPTVGRLTAEETELLALCVWSEGRMLEPAWQDALEPEAAGICAAVQRAWQQQGDSRGAAVSSVPVSAVKAGAWMNRAVELRLLRTAAKLAGISAAWNEMYALSLYRHGYVMAAADRLLSAMSAGPLGGEGLFALGEVLYGKGYYGEAASMFEQAVGALPQKLRGRAHTGAALGYLQLARRTLLEGAARCPEVPALREDANKAEEAIRQLEGARWRTEWTAVQGRNRHVAEADLAVHDRP